MSVKEREMYLLFGIGVVVEEEWHAPYRRSRFWLVLLDLIQTLI